MSWGTETVFLLLVGLGLIAYIPALVAKRKGYSFITWWFYSWLLSVAAIIHVAIIPDKKAATVPDSYSLLSDAQTEDKNLARYRLFASIFAFLRMVESVYSNYIYGFDNLILADYISMGFFIGLTLSLLLGRKIIGLYFSIPFILSSSYYFLLNLANEEMQRSYNYPLLHIASLFDLLTYVTLAAAFIMSIKKITASKAFGFGQPLLVWQPRQYTCMYMIMFSQCSITWKCSGYCPKFYEMQSRHAALRLRDCG